MEDKANNGFISDIRKIFVGPGLKSEAMTWEVGQSISLGKELGRATVNHIEEIRAEVYVVHVKKGDSILPWKKINTQSTVEYNFNF